MTEPSLVGVAMKLPGMTEAEIEDLLKKPLVAKLATIIKDGTPRITGLWFENRGKTMVFNTHEKTTHASNIKRNPKVAVFIDTVEWPYKGVHMTGKARVDTRASTKEEIGEMYTRYMGDYQKAVAYGEKLISWGKRVFITFEPERIVTYDFTKAG